jgi:hypothetical protein
MPGRFIPSVFSCRGPPLSGDPCALSDGSGKNLRLQTVGRRQRGWPALRIAHPRLGYRDRAAAVAAQFPQS